MMYQDIQNQLDSTSDISLSDHELQLKEIVISSDFNNNHYDDEEFDSEDYSEDYDHSNDDRYDYNDHNKSSFKMLSFVCNVKGCLKKYTLKSSLKRHIQHHHIEKNPFICVEPQCFNMKFSTLDLLKRHQQKVHENQILHKRSYIRENIELDKILENNEIKIYERKYPCKVSGCNRVFDSKSAVASHKRFHNTEKEKKSNKCDVPVCDKISDSLYELWDHDLFHLENNRKICDETEYSQPFQNLQELNDDQQIYTNDNLGETEFNCDVQGCNFKIGQFEALKQHLNDYHNVKNYYVCNKEVYKRLCHLRAHQNRRKHHSQVEEKNYICDEPGCDNVYKSLYYLKKHKDLNHIKILLPYVYIDNVNFDIKQENTYYCNHSGCSYTTNQMEDLTNHKMIHTEEKNLVSCNIIDISENKIHNLRKINQINYKKDQHKAKAHSKSANSLFTLKSQSKNYNICKYIKKIQIPTRVSYDFVNKKQLDISNDISKGNELDTYRLRKRPRINKIRILDDDDNDCLCKFTGCRKIFNSVYSLKIHQQKFHMITKTYPCNKSECNFRTKFFEKLKKHQLEKHGY
ncbi:1472_t:CDS:2 [Rhizophagus irregularis]|nr:1472_t:CDS:2 [Rhizophagus irregularis]